MKRTGLIIGAVALLLGLLAIANVTNRKAPNSTGTNQSGGQPTGVADLLGSLIQLPHGDQLFQVTEAEDVWPKFVTVEINPLDVKVGDTQKMRVVLKSEVAVTAVSAEIENDVGKDTVILKPAGTDESGNLAYEGEWLVNNTHSKKYETVFHARDAQGRENTVTMAWTDPCSPPLGGDWSVDGNCAFSGVNGVDNGNLTVNNYTLTLNASSTFVWNPGKTITISGTGSIVKGVGATLKKTYLWIRDADNDLYTPSSTDMKAQDTQPASYQRRYSRSGIGDCDDTSASIYLGSTRTRYASLYNSSYGCYYAASQSQTCQSNSIWSGTYTLTSSPGSDSQTTYNDYSSSCGYYSCSGAINSTCTSGGWSPAAGNSSSPCTVAQTTGYPSGTSCTNPSGVSYQSGQTMSCGSGGWPYSTSYSPSQTSSYSAGTPCTGGTSCSAPVTNGATCQSNGTWSALTSCSPSTRTGYTTASVACGSSCTTQSQTCQSGGTWSGSGIGSCSPLPGTTYYWDGDLDGYGNPGASTVACSQPAGYVANGSDCYDSNASAKPGQTSWFTSNRGDGSFDYNCDNSTSKYYTSSMNVTSACGTSSDHYCQYGDCGASCVGNLGSNYYYNSSYSSYTAAQISAFACGGGIGYYYGNGAQIFSSVTCSPNMLGYLCGSGVYYTQSCH